MRKLLISFCLFPLLLIISCSSEKPTKKEAMDLITKEEAMDLIRKANGYPKAISTYFSFSHNDPLVDEIKRLVREGYLTKTPDEFGLSNPKITERGKELIEFVEYMENPIKKTPHKFAPYTHKLDIKSIIEILSGKNNISVVKYEVCYFPTEYFIHLRQVDRKKMDNVAKEDFIKQIRIKKSDQGWQVIDGTDTVISMISK